MYLGAAETVVASMGALFSVWHYFSEECESFIAVGHEQTDETAGLEGQAMSVQQAIEYALKDKGLAFAAQQGWQRSNEHNGHNGYHGRPARDHTHIAGMSRRMRN
jgi:hypothetical protein